MRTRPIRRSGGLALAAAVLFAAATAGQPPAPDKKPTDKPADQAKAPDKAGGGKAAVPAKSKLEEMLEQALRDNPDLKVAAAKAQEAEAELNRARLAVVQKVVTHYQSLETQKAAVEQARATWEVAEAQYKRNTLPQSEYAQARGKLELAKADLARLEAETPYLLGKQPGRGGSWAFLVSDSTILDPGTGFLFRNQGNGVFWADLDADGRPDLLIANNLNPGGHRILGDLVRNAPPDKAAGPVVDRIRKALDTPVKADYKDKGLHDILKEMQETHGLPFVNRANDRLISLRLGDQPLGAVLEAITDVDKVEFFVRDYGVLVADGGQALPPGAVRVHDFWKSKPNADLAANPPPEDIKGQVEATESNGNVRLNIGSDAGLKEGHTLELFRLSPAKYLGRVRVVRVTAHEAVAQPVGRLSDKLIAGDLVRSRLTDKADK